MIMTHLTSQDYVVSTWSGGTTTQVAIAPKGAVYADRDFLWRVSSATVDLEVSDFTALPDYDRLISTLEGEIDLRHNGGEQLHLAPYEVHAFDGGWETQSVGKCRDFNLMMRKGKVTGAMFAVSDGDVTVEDGATAVLFCGQGEAVLEAEGQTVVLKTGESVLAEGPGVIRVSGSGKLIVAQAWEK